MFRGWGFALAVTLCCALGSPAANASGLSKIIQGMGKSEFLTALREAAKGGRIKNGTFYLEHPIKFNVLGTKVEQSEFDIKALKALWPKVPLACLLWAKCRHEFDDK